MKRSIQREELMNNDHRLTEDEKTAKYHIIDQIIAHSEPVPTRDLDLDHGVLAAIIEKGAIVVEDGLVNFAYPVSGLETVHQVTLRDGRRFSSMCAIDAMGTAFAFGQDVTIEDQCARTGEPIHLTIEEGRITNKSSDQIHVIHVNLKAFDNWSASC